MSSIGSTANMSWTRRSFMLDPLWWICRLRTDAPDSARMARPAILELPCAAPLSLRNGLAADRSLPIRVRRDTRLMFVINISSRAQLDCECAIGTVRPGLH